MELRSNTQGKHQRSPKSIAASLSNSEVLNFSIDEETWVPTRNTNATSFFMMLNSVSPSPPEAGSNVQMRQCTKYESKRGASSTTQPAMAETQELPEVVRAQLEEKENQKYSVFKAMSFKCQLVAGTNYFIKVDTGGENFLHLRVFKSLPHENKPLVLAAYQTKSRHDELAYF
ncbi:cystatin-B-like [Octodon degus]|uniref:Cystatin-B n=1 Tax=Octodon degus TaxID=10160 RepID=A0A6P6DGX4_OCTDE|nr:cystatin-B-like [Octodon degus]